MKIRDTAWKPFMSIILIVLLTNISHGQSKTWVAPKEANSLKNPFANNSDAISNGKKLYMQLCSICHGDKGKGDGIAGVALTPRPANFSSDQVQSQSDGALFWKLAEGRAPMAAYKDLLKEEDRWQLVSYIRTLSKK